LRAAEALTRSPGSRNRKQVNVIEGPPGSIAFEAVKLLPVQGGSAREQRPCCTPDDTNRFTAYGAADALNQLDDG
jgi:hypothetical protein